MLGCLYFLGQTMALEWEAIWWTSRHIQGFLLEMSGHQLDHLTGGQEIKPMVLGS